MLHIAPPPLILAFWLASPSSMFTQVRLCDRRMFNTQFPQFCICVLANSVPEVWRGRRKRPTWRQGGNAASVFARKRVVKRISPDVTGPAQKWGSHFGRLHCSLFSHWHFHATPSCVPRQPLVWPKAAWCFVCTHDKLLTSAWQSARDYGTMA